MGEKRGGNKRGRKGIGEKVKSIWKNNQTDESKFKFFEKNLNRNI